ncbi:hypothetical protein [Paenarthrobacter sp. JL.01a]|uniref:hypothetical protein n=1 Tax=Paenarthrobacter sp. JL.01a TaxID=2979324 RepID=UPI0021C74EEF|nr:hypothetical protein [Paenarthrobacter sp. JL.01a]UXM92557.1 hypothetical protein N5P29_04305 [Paenarthrobacter sp. JL.01a]
MNVSEADAVHLGPDYVPYEEETDAGAATGGDPAAPSGAEKPAGNAGLAEWQAYAAAQGKTEEELKDLKREEIKALFESE